MALRYTGDDPSDYRNIFDNAKFDIDAADQDRLIQALRVLSTGENLETAVNVDEVLRYFTVQVFAMNWDSYLGTTTSSMRRTGCCTSCPGTTTWPSVPTLWG